MTRLTELRNALKELYAAPPLEANGDIAPAFHLRKDEILDDMLAFSVANIAELAEKLRLMAELFNDDHQTIISPDLYSANTPEGMKIDLWLQRLATDAETLSVTDIVAKLKLAEQYTVDEMRRADIFWERVFRLGLPDDQSDDLASQQYESRTRRLLSDAMSEANRLVFH